MTLYGYVANRVIKWFVALAGIFWTYLLVYLPFLGPFTPYASFTVQ